MDLRQELQVISRTGKYIIGFRESILAALNKKARVLILARNCPEKLLVEAKMVSGVSGVPLLMSSLSSEDIGASLRKPFRAAVLAVIDPGNSNILEAVGESESE